MLIRDAVSASLTKELRTAEPGMVASVHCLHWRWCTLSLSRGKVANGAGWARAASGGKVVLNQLTGAQRWTVCPPHITPAPGIMTPRHTNTRPLPWQYRALKSKYIIVHILPNCQLFAYNSLLNLFISIGTFWLNLFKEAIQKMHR